MQLLRRPLQAVQRDLHQGRLTPVQAAWLNAAGSMEEYVSRKTALETNGDAAVPAELRPDFERQVREMVATSKKLGGAPMDGPWAPRSRQEEIHAQRSLKEAKEATAAGIHGAEGTCTKNKGWSRLSAGPGICALK